MNRTKLLSIRGCCKEAEDDLCESLCELGFKRLALSADLKSVFDLPNCCRRYVFKNSCFDFAIDCRISWNIEALRVWQSLDIQQNSTLSRLPKSKSLFLPPYNVECCSVHSVVVAWSWSVDVAKAFVLILKLFLLSCKLVLWIIYIT